MFKFFILLRERLRLFVKNGHLFRCNCFFCKYWKVCYHDTFDKFI